MTLYPKEVEIKGSKYSINTDFKTALRCFEVIEDDSICDEERALAVLYLLFGFIPSENAELFLKAASIYLMCGEEAQDVDGEKDMDLILDTKYIIPSFRSDYGIDLEKADMHYWEYMRLIQGLTPDCVLSRVRDIRNYDTSEISDARLKNKIIDAQRAVSLPPRYTKGEKEMIAKWNKLFGDDADGS